MAGTDAGGTRVEPWQKPISPGNPQDKSRASRDVKRLALDHIAEITAKIAAMSSVRDAVQDLADKCDGNDRRECPIPLD